jgi:VanZ family protein
MRLPTLTDSQIRQTFRLVLLVCVLVIAYLSFAPLKQLPGGTNDKFDHFLAFGVLTWLADRSYPGRRLQPYRWTLLLSYGLMIELIQGLLPFRDCSLLDFAADAAGITGYELLLRIRLLLRSCKVAP